MNCILSYWRLNENIFVQSLLALQGQVLPIGINDYQLNTLRRVQHNCGNANDKENICIFILGIFLFFCTRNKKWNQNVVIWKDYKVHNKIHTQIFYVKCIVISICNALLLCVFQHKTVCLYLRTNHQQIKETNFHFIISLFFFLSFFSSYSGWNNFSLLQSNTTAAAHNSMIYRYNIVCCFPLFFFFQI